MSTQPPAPQPTGGLGTAKPDTTSQIDNPVLPPDLDSFSLSHINTACTPFVLYGEADTAWGWFA